MSRSSTNCASANALLHQENYHHSYPHCLAQQDAIIFRAMDQWFIRIDHERKGHTFRAEAQHAIEQVAWIPDWARTASKRP